MICTTAISRDPIATVPKWKRIKFTKLRFIGPFILVLFLVKNHVPTAPAITICWHPMMNWENQNSPKRLYHLVTIMVGSFTYFTLWLFPTDNVPELSIQMLKYTHKDISIANDTNVYNERKIIEVRFIVDYLMMPHQNWLK